MAVDVGTVAAASVADPDAWSSAAVALVVLAGDDAELTEGASVAWETEVESVAVAEAEVVTEPAAAELSPCSEQKWSFFSAFEGQSRRQGDLLR